MFRDRKLANEIGCSVWGIVLSSRSEPSGYMRLVRLSAPRIAASKGFSISFALMKDISSSFAIYRANRLREIT